MIPTPVIDSISPGRRRHQVRFCARAAEVQSRDRCEKMRARDIGRVLQGRCAGARCGVRHAVICTTMALALSTAQVNVRWNIFEKMSAHEHAEMKRRGRRALAGVRGDARAVGVPRERGGARRRGREGRVGHVGYLLGMRAFALRAHVCGGWGAGRFERGEGRRGSLVRGRGWIGDGHEGVKVLPAGQHRSRWTWRM